MWGQFINYVHIWTSIPQIIYCVIKDKINSVIKYKMGKIKQPIKQPIKQTLFNYIENNSCVI